MQNRQNTPQHLEIAKCFPDSTEKNQEGGRGNEAKGNKMACLRLRSTKVVKIPLQTLMKILFFPETYWNHRLMLAEVVQAFGAGWDWLQKAARRAMAA